MIVARLRIAPFIATLATLLALRGITIAAFGEETVPLVEGRAAFVVLQNTRFGRPVYAICGALSGLAGILFAVRVAAGLTNYGLGLELDTVT